MEFEMQEWLTVIVVLLIIGVALDGWRRMRLSKRHSIKMPRKVNKASEAEAPEQYGSELPNGGARVIGVRDNENTRELTRNVQAGFAKSKKTLRRSRIPEQVALNLDEEVPMLMDSVPEDEPVSLGGSHADVLLDRGLRGDGLRSDDLRRNDSRETGRKEPSIDSWSEQPSYDDEPELGDGSEWAEDSEWAEGSEWPEDSDDLKPEQSESDEYDDDTEPELEVEEVLVINVMSVGGERFQGADLLTVLLQCGMRFGDMQIFHRHEDEDGEGTLLFSMVNMVVPGTFDLSTMNEFETPGVSFFMTLPMNANSIDAFNIMAKTATTLAESLGGELKDEHRSVMTQQTIEHCRHRIREFERKQLSRV